MDLRKATNLWIQKRARELERPEPVVTMAKRWVREWGPDRPVQSISSADIEVYRLERDTGARGANALNKEGAELRRFFEHLKALGVVGESPATVWRRRREAPPRRIVALSREEEAAVLARLPAELRRWARFAILTGLRSGTIRRLERRHIVGERLVIPGELMKERRPVELPLSRAALEIAEGVSGGPLFSLPPERKMRKILARVGQEIGLERLSPHVFRATFVSRMREAGADQALVMQLGGWRSPSVMIRHYYDQPPAALAREYLERI